MSPDLTAWEDVLVELEHAVDDVEARRDAGTGDDARDAAPWVVPSVGALPAELRERALVLLGRQQRAIDALIAARAGTARDIALLRRVPGGRGDAPAYLDVEG